jgi:hypothetical protein
MSRHEIKRNDTRPFWPVTLTYDDGTVADLNSASVRFIAMDSSGVVAIDSNAVITDPVAGQCEWRPGALDTQIAGIYSSEWEVTFADGTIQTFPTRTYDKLVVVGDLG